MWQRRKNWCNVGLFSEDETLPAQLGINIASFLSSIFFFFTSPTGWFAHFWFCASSLCLSALALIDAKRILTEWIKCRLLPSACHALRFVCRWKCLSQKQTEKVGRNGAPRWKGGEHYPFFLPILHPAALSLNLSSCLLALPARGNKKIHHYPLYPFILI